MRRQRAFSLVEMVTAISVGSVLMVLAMGTVHRAMRIESTARDRDASQRTSARLARQFRHDLHRAKSVSLDRQEIVTTLLLEYPDQPSIAYRVIDNGLLRERQLSDPQLQREEFLYPEHFQVELGILPSPQRATLTVRYETQLVNVSPRIQLHLEAVSGQLLRLSQSEGDSP